MLTVNCARALIHIVLLIPLLIFSRLTRYLYDIAGLPDHPNKLNEAKFEFSLFFLRTWHLFS